jgi:hypothetical protein
MSGNIPKEYGSAAYYQELALHSNMKNFIGTQPGYAAKSFDSSKYRLSGPSNEAKTKKPWHATRRSRKNI